MKIKSQFKDYYDYVQHIYGGGDPKIVYHRRRIGEYIVNHGCSYVQDIDVIVDAIPSPSLNCGYRHLDRWLSFDWLIVCGKPFPLVKVPITVNNLHIGSYAREVLNESKLSPFVTRKSSWPWDGPRSGEIKIGEELPILVEITRKVGHPIFIIKRFVGPGLISSKPYVVVDGECPILASLGFASIYSPEQLYQDLSYFLINKMKESPDMMPPTKMTDKEKITQHGFDVKKSFRHRK